MSNLRTSTAFVAMGYEGFMMAHILSVHNKRFNKMTLEDMYDMALDWLDDFKKSKHSDMKYPLYDCMEMYVVDHTNNDDICLEP